MSDIKKVVLAYPGGLDMSVILKWLQETYQCEVVTFTADLGQGDELEPAKEKAKAAGVKEIFIEDLKEEFPSLKWIHVNIKDDPEGYTQKYGVKVVPTVVTVSVNGTETHSGTSAMGYYRILRNATRS